jgi:hypothetical protein
MIDAGTAPVMNAEKEVSCIVFVGEEAVTVPDSLQQKLPAKVERDSRVSGYQLYYHGTVLDTQRQDLELSAV